METESMVDVTVHGKKQGITSKHINSPKARYCHQSWHVLYVYINFVLYRCWTCAESSQI